MTSSREEALFREAMHLPADKQEAHVRKAAGDDTALAERVLRMLRDDQATVVDNEPRSVGHLVEGDMIGPHTVTRRLGSGAQGVVYLARQQSTDREVAIKVIFSEKSSRKVLARFESEQRTLASLTHPSVAAVYDADITEEGRPYFVMEYVDGLPINEFCDDHQLDTRARLDLFIKVCEGVAHAQSKGFIHRDLKPDNILVTMTEDGEAQPKIIDFGIARALHEDVTNRPGLSETGKLIGTPAYMSPEQADARPDLLSLSTDVYALGVVLYQLICGRLPFEPDDLEAKGNMEMLRVIKEDQAPRPSTSLTSLDEDTGTDIASARKTTLRSLSEELRRELEWIPMMALRKEPERRYESASAMAEDVRRYLANEPLKAAPESRAYRARKFVRRHKAAVISTALITLSLVTMTTWSLAERNRALVAEQDALAKTISEQEQRSRAEQLARQAEEQERDAVEQRQASEDLYYNANLRTAKLAERVDDIDEKTVALEAARTFLSSPIPIEQMPFEWQFLRNNSSSFHLATKAAHAGYVSSLAYSPDGVLLATAGSGGDGTIRVWHADSLEGLHALDLPETRADTDNHPGAKAWANVVVFAPDSGQLVSGSSDGIIHFWDLEEGKPTRTFMSSVEPNPMEQMFSKSINEQLKAINRRTGASNTVVDAIAFSPGGDTMVSAHRDGPLRKWDVQSGEQVILDKRTGMSPSYRTIAFSPDGSRMVTRDFAGQVTLWDTTTWAPLKPQVIEAADLSGIGPVAFSPRGESFITSTDNGLTRFSSQDGTRLEHHDVHFAVGRNAQSLVFNSTGEDLFLAGPDDVHRYTLETRELLPMPYGSRPSRIALNPADDSLAAGENTGNISLLVGYKGKAQAITGMGKEVVSLAISPDSSMMAVAEGGQANSLLTLRTTSGKDIRSLQGHDVIRFLDSVTFSPDGLLVAASNVFQAIVWDARTGEVLRTFKDRQAEERGTPLVQRAKYDAIAFSPGGRWLAAAVGEDVQILDVHTGHTVTKLNGHTANVRSLAFRPDGLQLATGSNDRAIRIWDSRTGRCLHVLNEHEQAVSALASSPDGRLLGSMDSTGMVRLWNWATGVLQPQPAYAQLYRLPSNRSMSDKSDQDAFMMTSLEFHPRDSRIASIHKNTVAIWDTDTGNEVMRFDAPENVLRLHQLAFSPDGNRLFAGGRGAEQSTIGIFHARHGGQGTVKQPTGNSPSVGDTSLPRNLDEAVTAYEARATELQPLVESWFAESRDEQMTLLDENVLALLDGAMAEHEPDDQAILRNLVIKRFVSGVHTDEIVHHEYMREKYRKDLGDDDRKTLRSACMIARRHWLAGNRTLAIEMLEESLPVQRKALGDSHELTLWTVDTLRIYHEKLHPTHPDQGHDARAKEYRALHAELSKAAGEGGQ
ncbi:MAG: protein kinase [Phycisphaerales bacterium]|nr:protein kinase [Phycisphaerales bacterium]